MYLSVDQMVRQMKIKTKSNNVIYQTNTLLLFQLDAIHAAEIFQYEYFTKSQNSMVFLL